MRLRSEGLSTRQMGGETIVLDLESSRYLTVTGIGVRILEELADGKDVSIDHLVATIVAEYDVDEDVARRDIAGFAERMAEVGLLAA